MLRADLVTSIVLLVVGFATMVEVVGECRLRGRRRRALVGAGHRSGPPRRGAGADGAHSPLRSVAALRRPAEGTPRTWAGGGAAPGRRGPLHPLCRRPRRAHAVLARDLPLRPRLRDVFGLARIAERASCALSRPPRGDGRRGGDGHRRALRLPDDLSRPASLRRRGAGTSRLRLRRARVFLEPDDPLPRRLGDAARHRHRRPAGADRHHGRRADDHADPTPRPDAALLVLICTYVGAIYGGSRSAILLNIPGTPASAASCLDGYPLAQRGPGRPGHGHRHRRARSLGTWIGMLFLGVLTPVAGRARRSISAPTSSSGSPCSAWSSPGNSHRRRPAEGLARRLPRPAGRDGRAGGHPRPCALHLRHPRSRRRLRR